MPMTESEYLGRAETAFRTIEDAFEEIDPDEVEAVAAGDVLTLIFRDRSRCVINTQRPTRQIWVAAQGRGLHFTWDDESQRWVDDKDHDRELFATLSGIVRTSSGVEVAWG